MKLSAINEYMLPVRGLPLKSTPPTVLPDKDKDLKDKPELPGEVEKKDNPIEQMTKAVGQDSSNMLGVKRF